MLLEVLLSTPFWEFLDIGCTAAPDHQNLVTFYSLLGVSLGREMPLRTLKQLISLSTPFWEFLST